MALGVRPAAGGSLRTTEGLGGRCRGGLFLPGHRDGPLAVAGVHIGGDLWAREGQHAVTGQGTGDGRLVHIGRQAVPAVELTGDVAVIILTCREEEKALSEAPGAHPSVLLTRSGLH